MSDPLTASTVRPPSFRSTSLADLHESHEPPAQRGADADAGHGVDPRDVLLVTERQPGAVTLVDSRCGDRLGRVADVGRGPHTVAVHPAVPEGGDPAVAYSQSRQGWVTAFDLRTGESLARLRGGFSGRSVTVTADGDYVAAGYYNPNHLVIVDAGTLEPLGRIEAETTVDGEAVESRVCAVRDVPGEESLLVTLKDAGVVWFVDYGTEEFPVVDELAVGSVLHDGVFSPDGRYCYLADQGEECLVVVDVVDRTVAGRVPTAGPPHPTPGALDADRGLGFAATLGTDAVTAWDLDTLEQVATVDVPGHGMFVAGHPDADYVWGDVVFDGTDRDNDGLLYRIDPGEQCVDGVVDTAEWGAGRSLHPEFARDGTTVAACLWDADRVVGLDAATGDHRYTVDGVETPTGTFLAGRAATRPR